MKDAGTQTLMAFPATGAGPLRVVRAGANAPGPVVVESGSILARSARGVPRENVGGAVMLWSGSFAEGEGGGLFEEDPRTWGPRGWAALEHGVRAMGLKADGPPSVWVRPHARHVVSDVPGVRRVLDAEWGAGLGVALEPAAMLTAAMAASAGAVDLLTRVYEAVELLPAGRVMVIVSAPAAALTSGEGEPGVWDGGRAVLSGAVIRGLVERCVPSWAPLVIRGEGWESGGGGR